MNILIFSPTLSHPQNEGNCKRIFTFTKYLQTLGHTIHFVYFTQSGLNRKSFELMLNEWDTLTIIDKTISFEPSSTGYELDSWYQDDIHTIVNEIVETFDIEAVLVNYIMQSKLLEYLPSGIVKIIDTHDTFVDRHLMFTENNAGLYYSYSVSKEDEIKALNRADIILAIQKEEADYFSTVTDVPVKIINHLESKHFTDRPYTSLQKIGFVGSGNPINNHSIHKFLNEYFKHPISNKDIQIIIAGAICNKITIEHPNIILKGIVDDLEEFYNDIDLIINPLTFGTGLKIKSVEALSYGVPIISTKVGFEGIKSKHICHQIDTLEEMVECIDTIYKSPAKLLELEKFSKTIFDTYETKVKRKIEKLFKIKNLDKVPSEQDIHQSLKKKESTLYQQHKQIQMNAFNQKENEKKILLQAQQAIESEKKIKQQQAQIQDFKKSEKQQKGLMDLIHETTKLRLMRHPIKKHKAYKSMLKTYFNIKRK